MISMNEKVKRQKGGNLKPYVHVQNNFGNCLTKSLVLNYGIKHTQLLIFFSPELVKMAAQQGVAL